MFVWNSEFLIAALLNTATCWDSSTFLKCVERGTKIGHIVDLLHSKLDLNRCRWVASATWNLWKEILIGNSLTIINNPEKECGIVSRYFQHVMAQKKKKIKFNLSSMAPFTISLPSQIGTLQSSLYSRF